jgi:hypothetical protein
MKLNLYDAKELNFVELNYTGGNDTYIRCDRESKYIDSVVFNLFAPCFERANKLYEYYGPTKYNARKIIPLRNELIQHRDKLVSIKTIGAFDEHISSHFLGKEFLEALDAETPDWKKEWKSYLEKLISINSDMIELSEKCADEEKILWVVGY